MAGTRCWEEGLPSHTRVLAWLSPQPDPWGSTAAPGWIPGLKGCVSSRTQGSPWFRQGPPRGTPGTGTSLPVHHWYPGVQGCRRGLGPALLGCFCSSLCQHSQVQKDTRTGCNKAYIPLSLGHALVPSCRKALGSALPAPPATPSQTPPAPRAAGRCPPRPPYTRPSPPSLAGCRWGAVLPQNPRSWMSLPHSPDPDGLQKKRGRAKPQRGVSEPPPSRSPSRGRGQGAGPILS